MNIAREMPTDTTITERQNSIVNRGKLRAASMEAKEMILLIKKLKNHTTIVKPRAIFNPGILKARPKSTPKVVATPFPPLNLKNIVQLCPHMQHNPMIILKFCA
jgi:hypothetical protein